MTYKLQSVSEHLLDCTVTSPNGARYIVQVFDTRTRAGFQVVIQRIGAPATRPLDCYRPNMSVAIAEINNVLKKIGVGVER